MTTIPPQMPQLPVATRSNGLQALALQAGETLEGKIIGPAPNGATQVEIRGQVVSLVLPMPVKAGQVIALQVQGSGQQLQLAVQVPTQQVAQPLPMPVSLVDAVPLSTGTVTAQPGQQPAAPVVAGQLPQVAPQANMPGQTTTAAPAPVAAQPVGPGPTTPPATAPTASVAQPTAAQIATPPAGSLPVQAAQAAVVQSAYQAAMPSSGVAAVPGMPATTGTAAVTNGAPATTPQVALGQMVQAAVPRQNSVVALTTALTAVAGKVVLPEQVQRAAQQVLAGQLTLDGGELDGPKLQAAVRGSGIFQEAVLARGQVPMPQVDMKSALLALRQTLGAWLGQQAPIAAVQQPPPPLRGSVPRGKMPDPPPVDPAEGGENVGKHLFERTEAALSRVRLHQHASLPDASGKTADWSLDLPVVIGQHQTLMQIQIHRDDESESGSAAERGWHMRFAMTLPDLGEVGAQVSLRGGTTGVMLWASAPEASTALEAEVNTLREDLVSTGLKPGAVIVRHGEPPVVAARPSGHFVDART